MPLVFFHNNTERIFMKFAEDNHYYKQIKWLHFGWNWNRDKGAGCDRIFKSMSIGIAVISNRRWCL